MTPSNARRSSSRTTSRTPSRSPITSTCSPAVAWRPAARPTRCARPPIRTCGSSSRRASTGRSRSITRRSRSPPISACRPERAPAMTRAVLLPFVWLLDFVAYTGRAARFFVRLCGLGIASLRRPRLVVDQIHFIGNYSLSIILVSGLLIGFVLGLQGYYTLRRYGSEEALGVLVTLSLVRELGPVVTALL